MSNAPAPAGVDLAALGSIFPALAAANNAAAAAPAAPAPANRDKSKVWVNVGYMGSVKNERTGEEVPTFFSIIGYGLDEDKLERPLNSSAFKNQITKEENAKRVALYDLAMGLEPGQEVLLAVDTSNGIMVQLRRVREEATADQVPSVSTGFELKLSTALQPAAPVAA